MREIVSLTYQGQVLWGTRHLTEGPPRDIGVLLFNGGQVPRGGHSGMSARAADRLARAGVPVFRVDLPGLGDSFGAVPVKTSVFWRSVEEGHHVSAAIAVAEHIKERYGIDRLIAGGLCGAAVNAIYLADRRPALLDGLLLLEPEFFLTPVPGEEPVAPANARSVLQKLLSRRTWLRLFSGESRYGRRLSFARRIMLRLLVRRTTLPENVNLPLALSWARVVARGVPCLVMTAEGRIREAYTEQVKRVVLDRHTMAHVRHVSLSDTNHIFTSGGAIERCAAEMTRWIEETFAKDRRRRAA